MSAENGKLETPVERWDLTEGSKMKTGPLNERTGHWVKASDYDKLQSALSAANAARRGAEEAAEAALGVANGIKDKYDTAKRELKEARKRRLIGSMMSNLCYNGAQNAAIPEQIRKSMTDLYKRWDAALSRPQE